MNIYDVVHWEAHATEAYINRFSLADLEMGYHRHCDSKHPDNANKEAQERSEFPRR